MIRSLSSLARAAALLTLVACASQRTAPVVSSPVTPTATAQGTVTPADPPPAREAAPIDPEGARWAALSMRLRAHDDADLPDAAALSAIDDVQAGLVWLSLHGDPVFVRVRAAERLGLVASSAGQAHLLGLLTGPDTPTEVRAGAVAGLAHRVTDGEPAVVDALVQAAAHPESAVALEAVEALRGAPSAWPALRTLASSGLVGPVVVARIDELR